MDRIKIQEIADEVGVSNEVLIEKSKELGYDVTESNSFISIVDAGVLVDYAISGRLPKDIKKKDNNNNRGDTQMSEENTKKMGEIEKKNQRLKEYHSKIIRLRDELEKDKSDFIQYKKVEEHSLKKRLMKEEINHKNKLEEEKIKTITQLQEDFFKKIESEYKKISSQLDNLTQKELKLIEWQQKVEQSEKIFTQNKELFESEKDKLLNLHKEELEKDKEIFLNKLGEERINKLEKINETIDELYKKKEESLANKEEELRMKEAELKTSMAEVKAKERSLDLQEESLYKQAQEKIELEIKSYQEKVKSFEKQNQASLEELTDLRKELNSYEKFEDRDLPRELDEKQQELSRLNTSLVETTKMKNDLFIQLEKKSIEYENEKNNLENEITTLLQSNLEVESLKSRRVLLEDQLESKEDNIEILKGERKDLKQQLKSIYSDGTEIEERVKDIKEKPFKEIRLESEINITDEIKYLDSIEDNMKKYGVEYPKRLLYAFHTALKSAEFSPLAVLSGVSGTGKSELPKLYSHFGGFNFLAEAVQPTWDSPASMIGYYNTIDRKFDSTNILKFLIQTSQSKSESPFGLKDSMNMILLDEMNLAHIELYFAEFLSKFEQRRGSADCDVNIDIQLGTALIHKLPLDRNMLWIGTMNEDETTKSLSDKVLDRAFSINFPRPTELKSRAKLKTLDEIKAFEYLHRDTWNKWIKKESLFTGDREEVLQKYKEMSNNINEHLAPTGRAIGHRVWQSMEYYISNHPLVIQNIDNEDELIKNVKLAFEEQLVQKIMPKLRGIEVHGKEKEALMSIKDILNKNDFKMTEDFELSMDNPYGQFIWNSANYLKED